MDEAVIKIYRRLLQTGFEYAGSLENPSIFLDSKGANLAICDVAGRDYVNIYINVKDGRIDDIRYMCSCDPTANVVIETMCSLIKDKTLGEAGAIEPEDFFRAIGSSSETVDRKTNGIIELLNRGRKKFLAGDS